MATSEKEAICCPKFDPALWDNEVVEWKNRKFIQDKIRTLFFVPLNFGKVMRRMDQKVSRAGAETPDRLCLSEHTSKWNMDVFLAVEKEVKDAQNTTLTGKFFCKVYEGNFSDTGKWTVDFEAQTKAKGYASKRTFMWYTTCPKCAKKYGKNYVVILGQIE